MSEPVIYKYHKVFDGYNFLSRAGAMEEIVGCDMELVCVEDYAVLRAKVEALEKAMELQGRNPTLWLEQYFRAEELQVQLAAMQKEMDHHVRQRAYAIEETIALKAELAAMTERVRQLEVANKYFAISEEALAQERDWLKEALTKIAKPALGGKQQQWIAQAALRGEPGGG